MSEHSCCPSNTPKKDNHCHSEKTSIDWLLWGSFLIIAALYLHQSFFWQEGAYYNWYALLAASVFELMNTLWWGLLLGIIMVAVLSKVPREFVISILGTNTGLNGILRATAAGVLLDLCNHGILMVASKLYERGASIGQVIAFLVASPWNSFSLTIILIALVGLPWTLAFIVCSMFIAIIAGLLFDYFVTINKLPENPIKAELPENFKFWREAKSRLSATQFNQQFIKSMLVDGIKDSRMVIRWILFGVVLAGLVRAFVSPEDFGTYFGPTMAGLGLTLLAATVIEICSEGSTPIAADILHNANAPGNAFAFLMTGVATDYTEIMVIKETTKSWKVALFIPLLTVPQVVVIAWVMNSVG